MTNEEFQRIVLKELRGLREGQKNLEARQSNLEEGQEKLEARQSNLEKDIKQIKHNQVYIWEDIKRLDRRLENQENKIRRIVQ